MTQPNNEGDADLLRRLGEVSGKQVGAAAEKVANFSAEDEENDKRWWKAQHRRTMGRIKRALFLVPARCDVHLHRRVCRRLLVSCLPMVGDGPVREDRPRQRRA